MNENQSKNSLKIIDVPLNFKNSFNIPIKTASNFIIKSLHVAHEIANKKGVKGIINCPIDKKLIKNTGKIGITEFLAAKCKVIKNTEVMMIYNKNLSVVPVTTHIKLKDVSKKISVELINKKLLTLNKEFKKLFKFKPKIAILGLNPHNGEFKKNSEEVLKIIPAIKKLEKKGVNVTGPISADTFFISNFKKFNVVVGMYHDQVLVPVKTLFHFNAINVTLGLKYLRVSPDHGPGKDIIGKKRLIF